MDRIRSRIIFTIIQVIIVSTIFFSSCREKSTDGMIIITRAAGKFNDINYNNGNSWRYISEAHIVAINADNPERKPEDLTENYYSACSPDISFDGKQMLFAGQKKQNDLWQIWEMNLKDLRCRQVTSSKENCIDPAYLPGGRLVFSRNIANDSLKAGHSLFICNLDGSDLKRITFNPHTYFASSVLNDGRVLSISRQLNPDQNDPSLMVLRPDGTKAELFYKGFPSSRVREINDIRKESGNLVFIESGKENMEGGNVVSINYNRPLHTHQNLTAGINGNFLSVFPLHSGKLFVSYRKSQTDRYALYEFDQDKKILGKAIYDNKDFDVLEAVMVENHERPKKLPSEVDMGVKSGLLLCQDINVSDAQPYGSATLINKPSRIEIMGIDSSLGVVDVGKDGSFYLKVLADKPFQIRIIDENGHVLNKPCGWIWLRPNERRGCVGCHEDNEQVPENRVPLAVKNPPVIVPVHINKVKEKKVSLE